MVARDQTVNMSCQSGRSCDKHSGQAESRPTTGRALLNVDFSYNLEKTGPAGRR